MPSLFRIAVATIVVFNTFGASFALTAENTMLKSVYKVKVYETESIGGNYVFMQWGSAVLLDSNRIITNAHVILNEISNMPTGKYEICRSSPDKKDPECFTTAKLLSYDTVADLAVLELAKPVAGTKKLAFGKSNLSIGSNAIVYGYPGIGGLSITRTE
jgi:S1-C subfamily serine protease